MCECTFLFCLWSINFETMSFNCNSLSFNCHSISCFVTRFRQLEFKFSGNINWARDNKNNFVYCHSFSSKFQSNSSPRCKGSITLDEFEWQNNEFVRKNDVFDPTFLTRLATQTNFSDNWRIWMLNFEIWLTKKRIWMTIWGNWTLDLNAESFFGRNWIEKLMKFECRGDENGRENL